MSRSRVLVSVTTGALAVMLLASCTNEPTPVPSPTPSVSLAPSGDGVLRLGTTFPTTGSIAFTAPAQVAGVETAVREINETGGVLGAPVAVFHRDSGDVTTDRLEQSFADLVTKPIDVLIGPSTSVLAERILPAAIAARIPIITPAAISPRLTGLEDDGYLFRTIPSAALQGTLLAQLIGDGDAADVAVIYSDDETGPAIEASLKAAIEDAGGELVASEKLTGNTADVADIVAAVKKAKPQAVVLVTPFEALEETKTFITELSDADLGGAKLWLTSGNLHDYSQALPANLMTDVHGILEGAEPDDAFKARVRAADPGVTDFRYAAEAYDATIIAALAAIVAGDDGGASIAQRVRDVSSGGIKCTSFGECLDVLKTETDIDYDGISGPIDLDEAGDPGTAHFALFSYTAENKFTRSGDAVVD